MNKVKPLSQQELLQFIILTIPLLFFRALTYNISNLGLWQASLEFFVLLLYCYWFLVILTMQLKLWNWGLLSIIIFMSMEEISRIFKSMSGT